MEDEIQVLIYIVVNLIYLVMYRIVIYLNLNLNLELWSDIHYKILFYFIADKVRR